MTLLLFQKKPLFDRGNPRETWFWPLFRPPQKTPRNPQNCHFWPLFGPLKTPKTPKNPQNGQNSRKWPFLTKFAFLAKNYEDLISKTPLFDPPLGDSPPPPKMALFDPPRENPQKPPILAIFGHFLVKIWGCEWILAPLARLPISNNRVIRPQIWNLRRKRGFSVPPQVREMWVPPLRLKIPNYY